MSMKIARKRNIMIERKKQKRKQAKIAHQDPNLLRSTYSTPGAFGKCHYLFSKYPTHAELRRLRDNVAATNEYYNLLHEKKIGWILNNPLDDRVKKLVEECFIS